jgi:hypothetical protein
MPVAKNKVLTYLKELLSQCNMSPESVSIDNPKNSDSIDYLVHIKGTIHELDKQKAREVAKKHSLTVKEEPDGVIVYKPT